MEFLSSEGNTSEVSSTILKTELQWSDIAPKYSELLNRQIQNTDGLRKWLKDRSELESRLQEDLGWRYIRFTCDTGDAQKKKSLDDFVMEIEPKISEMGHKLNKKLLENPFLNEIANSPGNDVMLRTIRQEVALFCEENLPLISEAQSLANNYGSITGSFTVNIDGKELTFNQAANLLKEQNRTLRQKVYKAITDRRLQAKQELNELFSKLLGIRHKIAMQAGFDNYRDYMFASLGRFDYSAEDCKTFHQTIAESVLPICESFDQKRKEELGYDQLKPYDLDVDTKGLPPIVPYTNGADLIAKTIECFEALYPSYGDYMRELHRMGHLDLDSRKGKAPGGYNYPLYKTGVPFIFMNSAASLRDMITMIHEGGHAVHSFLSRNLELSAYKHLPSEIAELASMSMELLTLDHWDKFIKDPEELKRAKRYHLEKTISVLPWIALIDAFQHWVYENPQHSTEQRENMWLKLFRSFNGKVVDWSEFAEAEKNLWHRQLHLFEVPFYYIEYAIAQLGAIAVWRNYKQNGAAAIQSFNRALAAGYTQPLPELYAMAGIKFDFSKNYVHDLVQFVQNEIKALE